MWIRSLCIFACFLLCTSKELSEKEKIILEYREKRQEQLQKYKQCDHEDGDEARCVKKSLCKSLLNRYGHPGNNTHSEEDPTNFTFRERVPTVESGCTFYEICCPEDKIQTDIPPQVPQTLKCGYSNPGGSTLRELLDKYSYAAYGDFPWMVALLKTKDRTNINFATDYVGGGSLIHPSVIITVAHKVDVINTEELVCRAGEWNTTNNEEINRYQERYVNNIIIHGEFLRAHAHNDVALLILKNPFELANAPHIGMACLEPRMPHPGTECFSTGWGKDIKLTGNKNATIMKKLTLALVDGNSCQNLYRNSRLGRKYKLHKSLTCAGGEEGIDTCIGDGGSPLMCPINDSNDIRYSVVGMVVYGIDCGTANIPGVYLKVPQIYDWVIREMARQGFNKTFEY